MTAWTFVQLVGGVVLLAAGAESLVRGASTLALRVGISSLAVGLTVVAYGTSAPELVVSLLSSRAGQEDIAVANVVGSNIFNVLFILGVCAIAAPLVITAQVLRREVPIMIGASFLMVGVAVDGAISAIEGSGLLLLVAAYTWWTLRSARRSVAVTQHDGDGSRAQAKTNGMVRSVVLVLVGLAILVLGARWFVSGATSVARAVGLSDTVIGLTLVAAGTSLPEVATSIVATLRGQRDIAVGNVVGSNIYNILAILGVSAVVAPSGLHVSAAMVAFDIPVMTAVALACLPLFFTGGRLARWEGGVFLGYYVVYTVYLILASTNHDALTTISAVMLWFVLPITLLTIAVVVTREVRARIRARNDARSAVRDPAPEGTA